MQFIQNFPNIFVHSTLDIRKAQLILDNENNQDTYIVSLKIAPLTGNVDGNAGSNPVNSIFLTLGKALRAVIKKNKNKAKHMSGKKHLNGIFFWFAFDTMLF